MVVSDVARPAASVAEDEAGGGGEPLFSCSCVSATASAARAVPDHSAALHASSPSVRRDATTCRLYGDVRESAAYAGRLSGADASTRTKEPDRFAKYFGVAAVTS